MPTTIRFVSLSAFFGVLLVAVAPASAQLYKWIDADGVVNYGDWPPDGVKVQAVSGGTVSSVSYRALVASSARAPEASRSASRAAGSGVNVRTENSRSTTGATPSDPNAADGYVPYYDYGRRPAAAVVAAERRPVDVPVARPMLPIDPGIADMPLRPRR